jgi:Carboxypeptidase regulatory-like domain
MQKTFLRCLRIAGVAVLSVLLGTSAFAQGITTSALNGFVVDKAGRPVNGALITVVHEPSGTRSTTVTRPNGQYNLSGLRVGGPYTVTATAKNFQPVSQKEVYLSLGESQDVSFTLSEEVIALEAVTVTGSRDTTFDSSKLGNGTSYTSDAIQFTPSIRQDPQDLANNDPRFTLTENTSTGEFQLSAQGQNYRYNSFLIDGVQANDPFGLNGSGTSSWFSPIPFDAIAAFNIELEPYDVRRSGFTGALLNAVVKSGTNTFSGSASYRYTGQNMRGKNPVTLQHEPFRQRDYVLTLGGPIIKDRLFFFFTYEDYKKTSNPPSPNFIPDPTQLAQLITRAQALGYDPGTLVAQNVYRSKTYLAKLDWNINSMHKASFTFRRNDSNVPQFPGYNGSYYTSLSNYWYQQPRVTDSYTLQVQSDWTPNLHTEATAAYTKYDGSPVNNGKPFPEVYINGVSGTRLDYGTTITSGSVDIGTEFSRQWNKIYTRNMLGKFYAEYSIGDHKITFGGDSDKTTYTNQYVQAYDGSYTFSSVANWLAGTPVQGFTLAKLFPGYTIDQAFAHWSFTDYGLALQDTWRPNPNLSVLLGVRMDYPYAPAKPTFNGDFYNAFGFVNNTTGSGNYTVGPRLGFNYDLPKGNWLARLLGNRKTQLRGGLGLFQGTNPAVWLSNAYSNTGALGRVTASGASIANFAFNPDPTTQTPPPGTLPLPVMNVTDPSFKPPVSWKGNLAIDHTLPWAGLVLTLEADGSWVKRAAFVKSINIKTATAANAASATAAGTVPLLPDGRIQYNGVVTPNYSGTPYSTSTGQATGANQLLENPRFNTVYVLDNTGAGRASQYSISIRRPLKNHWAFSVGYTRSDATEVNPFTSSVAQSNFSGRAYMNPNENVASRTNYVTPDKIVVSFTREFNLFNNPRALTSATIVLRAQTGHPYSWTFKGDANGDGFSNNDLFYVPTGPTDPKVAWNNTAERDAFFNFVATSSLKNYVGKVAPRNGELSPYQETLDLHFNQDIPIRGKAKLQVFCDILNFANLLNDRWGVTTGVDFPYVRTAAGATFNRTGNGGQGQYVYYFNSNTLGGVPVFTDLARWQIQLGAKLEF